MRLILTGQETPPKWMKMFANAFDATVKADGFDLPSSIGQGTFRQFYPFHGLTLSYLRFNVNKKIEIFQEPTDKSSLLPIMFYPLESTLEQKTDGKTTPIGYHTSNGIFMLSPQISSQWTLYPNKWLMIITLTIDMNWFLEKLDHTEDNFIYRKIASGKPFYLFESLNPSDKKMLDSTYKLITEDVDLLNLRIHKTAMDLLILLLQKFEQRTVIKDTVNINSVDVQQIFQIRKTILENLISPPGVKQLSIEAGMSISKLQSCFKQVFGKSISQYALSEKMQLAKQLLDSDRYNVSDVGYKIGYSNLSHFTKAFNNEFGIKPKAYLNSK